MPGTYRYKPLDNDKEFRTVTIVSIRDGKVRCQLTHHPLPSRSTEQLEYDALSWTWGVDDELTSIAVVAEGKEDEMLSVRPNLIGALRGVAERAATKRFWIDALCINQADTHEKDLQVQLMFDIYSNARNVCIWLGEHKDNSQLALKFIRDRICDVGAFEKITRDESTKEEWKALAALMNRPWFSRRWVVQELALARSATVHCGDELVSWADFETAVALFERDAPKIAEHYKTSSLSEYDPDFFGDVANMRATRLVQAKGNLFRMNDKGQIMEYRFTLSDLVSNLSFFDAKEPHDLIYAILSLARDTHTRVRPSAPNQFEAMDAPTLPTQGASSSVPPPPRDSDSSPLPNTTPPRRKEPRKRKSRGEMDLSALSEAQKSGLERAQKRWKQSIQPENVQSFPVNYKQRFFDVCKSFLLFTIPKKEFPNLDILCRPWAPKAPRGESDLPSWITPVSNAAFGIRMAPHAPGGTQMKRKNADPLVGQVTYGTPYYNACKSMNAERDEWHFGNVKNGESEYSLFVTGFVLDTIGQLEDASQTGHIPLEWIRLGGWEPWTERGERDASSHPPDALWRTLVADRGPDGGNTKVYYRKAFDYAVTHSTFDVGVQTAELKQRGNSILVELLHRMEAVVWNRRLFRSERDGNLGLAPKLAQKGDYICIFRGCSVPVVMRPAPNGSHHTMIGECYLHTMMNGQALDVQEKLKEERKINAGELSSGKTLIDTQVFEVR